MKKTVIVLGCAIIAGSLGGVGYSAWVDDATTEGMVINSGTLDISLNGDAEWTKDGSVIDSSTYKSLAPSTYEFTQGFTTSLDGDNLEADMVITWVEDASFADDASATWSLYDSSGNSLIDNAVVGETTTVSVTESMMGENDYNFVFYVDHEGDSFEDPRAHNNEAMSLLVDLGKINIDLKQVR